MQPNLNTLKGITTWAKTRGVIVELKRGGVYECWRDDNHSTIAESYNLCDLRGDIEDLAQGGQITKQVNSLKG